jgi:hypothetical protein
MLAILSFTAVTFIAPLPTLPQNVQPARTPALSMVFMIGTTQRSRQKVETVTEAAPTPIFAPIVGGLKRLYPRRVVNAVATRVGLRRWLGDAAVTDAMLTAELHGAKLRRAEVATKGRGPRDLAEINWEESLLPPIPVRRRSLSMSLSELSWEDRLLPSLSTPTGRAPGRIKENSWEDRVLPTVLPPKPRGTSMETSWEDHVLPAAGAEPTPRGTSMETSWEERLP